MEKTYEGFFNRFKKKSGIIPKPILSKDMLDSILSDLKDNGFNIDIFCFYKDDSLTVSRSGNDDRHNSFNVDIYKKDKIIKSDLSLIKENLLFAEPYMKEEYGYTISNIKYNFGEKYSLHSSYYDFINNEKTKFTYESSTLVVTGIKLYIKKIQ